MQPVADPVRRPLDTGCFTAAVVDGVVGALVGPSRRGNLGPAVKGGQCRQRTIQTVVATPPDAGPAVVDELTVQVGSRVRSDQKTIAVAKSILDCRLIFGTLHRSQALGAVIALRRRAVHRRRGIRLSDGITQVAQTVLAQADVAFRRQSELSVQLPRDRLRTGVRMPASGPVAHVHGDMRGCRIGGVDEVHQNTITRQQPEAPIETTIGTVLRVFPEPLDIMRRDMRIVGDMYPHRDHGDRPPGCIRIPPDVVGRVRIVAVSTHRRGPVAFGPLSPVVLASSACFGHRIRRQRLLLCPTPVLPWIVPVGWMSGTARLLRR